jgi:hypothetical protein
MSTRNWNDVANAMFHTGMVGLLGFGFCQVAISDDTGDCEALNGVTPVCGFQNPEDLEAMPGNRLLIVSEYRGGRGATPGALLSYHIADETVERLFPLDNEGSVSRGDKSWGDPNCPQLLPESFAPHGIHHSVEMGAERLLVVNHGGRESIEIFEVALTPDGNEVSLEWRGCVVAPENVWFNDVVGLPHGGLAATHMMSRDSTLEQMLAIEISKADAGYVVEWQPATGWRQVPGTEGALPNGIEVSPNGKTLYVNDYLGGKIYALSRDSGERQWSIDAEKPDNSSWTADGKLLVAIHQGTNLTTVLECGESDAPFCPIAYEIIEIDPKTGNYEHVAKGSGAPMAAATVAVQIDSTLYLGTYAGKRLGILELSK